MQRGIAAFTSLKLENTSSTSAAADIDLGLSKHSNMSTFHSHVQTIHTVLTELRFPQRACTVSTDVQEEGKTAVELPVRCIYFKLNFCVSGFNIYEHSSFSEHMVLR